METTETLDRRTVILDSAFKVFMSYGFKRTTMADIADAAGISRPALYLEFKNKAAIYRAGFVDMLEKTFRAVDAELASDAPFPDQLIAALDAAIISPMRRIASMPHGAELFEVKQELADDIGEDWNTVLERTLERAIKRADAAGEITLPAATVSAGDLARLIVSTIEGLKKRVEDWNQAEADVSRLIDLMVRPLVKRDQPNGCH
jgi:AcrR family transcriptional regulator